MIRIRAFCKREGYNTFYMLNLFAFRATEPKDMMKAIDPVGPNNNDWLKRIARNGPPPICCWGTPGNHLFRDKEVYELLTDFGATLNCFGLTSGGFPRHPLYLPKNTELKPFVWKEK